MDPKTQYKAYYDQMFAATQANDKHTAAHYRALMEELRQASIASRILPLFDFNKLPTFVHASLNKNQYDLNRDEASNCINAAFNFSSSQPVFTPYTTMDFLEVIRSDFLQFQSRDELRSGDLVVFWSRFSDDWKDRAILVTDLIKEDPGFPFGLVFDHVAVYVGEDCLYHKPDPNLESRYQINHWDDVVGFSEVVNGFELTFHRRT